MINSKKYVRKPLYVEAVKVTPGNFLELAFWSGGSIRDNQGNVPQQDQIDPQTQMIQIAAKNPRGDRQAQARLGDWILKHEKGFKVYNDRAFKSSFDKIKEEPEVHENQGQLHNDVDEEPPGRPEPHVPTPQEPVEPVHQPTEAEPVTPEAEPVEEREQAQEQPA